LKNIGSALQLFETGHEFTHAGLEFLVFFDQIDFDAVFLNMDLGFAAKYEAVGESAALAVRRVGELLDGLEAQEHEFLPRILGKVGPALDGRTFGRRLNTAFEEIVFSRVLRLDFFSDLARELRELVSRRADADHLALGQGTVSPKPILEPEGYDVAAAFCGGAEVSFVIEILGLDAVAV